MIYGRFGDVVVLERMATLEDVQALEGRKPDAEDKRAIAAGSYVVGRYAGEGHGPGPAAPDRNTSLVMHLAFLRADKGLKEIMQAVEALPGYQATAGRDLPSRPITLTLTRREVEMLVDGLTLAPKLAGISRPGHEDLLIKLQAALEKKEKTP